MMMMMNTKAEEQAQTVTVIDALLCADRVLLAQTTCGSC